MLKCSGGIFPEQGDEYLGFLYSMLQEIVPTGLVEVHIPPLPKSALGDWEKFEYWLEDVHGTLDVIDLISTTNEMDPYELMDQKTPAEVLGNSEQIVRTVVELIKRSGEKMTDSDIWVGEVTHDDQILYLLFSWMDAWSLGHGDSVEVVESLDVLTEEAGYYYYETIPSEDD